MSSPREKEEKKRKRDEEDSSSGSSSSSEEERRHKKKHGDKKHKDKKEKKEKKEKKHKQKKDKKDKDKKDKKEKRKERTKLVEQAKEFMKANGINSALISDADYYSKSIEFCVWLTEEKKIFFEDLSTEAAHSKFSLFVEKWNAGELDDKYYKGMSTSSVDPSTRTKYKWSFASKLDPIELGSIRDAVDSDTNRNLLETKKNSARIETKPPPRVLGPMAGPAKPVYGQDDEDEEDRRRQQHLAYKKDVKEYKRNKEDVLDELIPKATGREAMLEKKKLRNEYHKKGDDSPEMDSVSLMGGGGDDFQARLRQEKQWKERRIQKKEDEYQRKLSDYQAKEDSKMAPLKALAQRFAQPPQ